MAIINNNVQNVKFLRNSTILDNRTAALAKLEEGKTLASDGSALLARYSSGSSIVTLVGFVAETGVSPNIEKHLTVFDVEGSTADVEKLRQEINAKLGTGVTSADTATAQLEALRGATFTAGTSSSADTSVEGAKAYAYDLIGTLDYTDTAETGSYVSKVDQVDGKISTTKVALPDASSVSGESKVIIDVTQDKGKITASTANLTGVKLDGYAEGTDADIAATDTLGEALGKLQAQINAMDKNAEAVAGQVVTTVAEADGKVTETKANVKDLQLGGYSKTNDTGDIASGDTINVALSKLENQIGANEISNKDGSITVTPATSGTDISVHIKSGENVIKLDGEGGGIYTNLNVVKVTTGLPETVKESYEVRDSNGVKIGDSIDIAKDSHIVSINYITTGEHAQNLEYVYIDVSGNTQTTYVDMSELVLETEFASGVTVTGHIAHGVVDPTSENFLTVGADGFKLSGVQDAIDDAIDALNVATINPGAGKYIYAIEENDGKIAASGANVSEAVLNNYSKGSDSGDVTASDTVNTAISKLENQVDAAEAAAKAAATVIAKGSSADTTEHLEIVTETDSTTGAKTYTFDLKDIASQTDLTELSGKTVTAITSTNNSITANVSDTAGNKTYNVETDASKIKMSGFTGTTSLSAISTSDSISEAFDKVETAIDAEAQRAQDAEDALDGRLDVIESGYVETVKVNNVALDETNNTVNVQISASTSASTATTASAIVVDTDENGTITLSLGGIDAGTY